MKLNEMYPSKYATGADLKGQPVTLTIDRIQPEKMRPNPASPEVEKFVIYFKEARRGVVLGKVLAHQVGGILASDETDDWIGKRITLYPESVVVAGTPRIAIRARAAAVPTNGNGKAA